MAENRGWLDNLGGKGRTLAGLAVVAALAGGSWLVKQNRPAVEDPAPVRLAAQHMPMGAAPAFPGVPVPVPGMQGALPGGVGKSAAPDQADGEGDDARDQREKRHGDKGLPFLCSQQCAGQGKDCHAQYVERVEHRGKNGVIHRF